MFFVYTQITGDVAEYPIFYDRASACSDSKFHSNDLARYDGFAFIRVMEFHDVADSVFGFNFHCLWYYGPAWAGPCRLVKNRISCNHFIYFAVPIRNFERNSIAINGV